MCTLKYLPSVLSCLLALALACHGANPVYGQGEIAGIDATKSVRQLMVERCEILRQLETLRTESYMQGGVGIDAVMNATQQLLEAELELAIGSETRIQVLERSFAFAGELHQIARAKHASGEETVAGVWLSRAEMLRIQTALMRAKNKQRPE